ncbi:SDR family NAD(P)-dependent oxidoreductase [Botrimarina hoheduenensis]|uniref:Putative oxidoreductase SadH n=1 Tax=Botrimarina hoheduenensis TaxID=2528000 RepID=A0A5C5VSL4_9BACT|nr:SDR family NAD(P)-dependent oxidoreductase [Botrimarina hoheduenensis]TWT41626.1 putative oxidoreductase SadH [Botrimarina hoheduenensis]
MRLLRGQRALVTGAASGIGRAIALELGRSGVDLMLVDVNVLGLERVRRDLEPFGVDVATHHADLSEVARVYEVAEVALTRWAGVDVLVNNAGVTYHGPTHTMPAEEWERLLAINLHAKLRLTQRLLPALLARPEAHILNVCSVLGLSGMPRVAAYCTTKFAMVGFSEALRAEYGRIGLGVTALCPGFVETGLFAAARPELPGGSPKRPPSWMCVSPERVARRAVRAIRYNQQRVVIDPVGRWVHGFKRLAPALFDTLLAMGRTRRIAKKHAVLSALDPDLQRALRAKLGLGVPTDAPQRVAA